MDDREQKHRERAYKIWEDEGRQDGVHEDHWKRADDQHQLAEQESDDVTRVHQEADDQFARDDSKTGAAADIKPPSTVSPD